MISHNNEIGKVCVSDNVYTDIAAPPPATALASRVWLPGP